jgi:outer membrane protein assembly factor BamE (lipoprotein component of BamABCDE complex)
MRRDKHTTQLRGISHLGLILVTSGLVAGCNTTQYKQFSDVKVGMDKSSIVEAAGSPNVVERYEGKDRWIYTFDDTPEGEKRREILFENERAVYVGPKIQPKVTAAEQDKINETVLEDETKRENEAELVRDKKLGIARVADPEKYSDKGPRKEEKVDELDLRLRDSLYGTTSSQELERNKVAPTFEPIE